MENLNVEKIKRGLACCKGSYDCFTCDIYKRGCAGWREGLAKDALALINSQEQRIKELTVDLEAMRGAANSYKMHNKELTEENERLREELEQRPPKLIITKLPKKENENV